MKSFKNDNYAEYKTLIESLQTLDETLDFIEPIKINEKKIKELEAKNFKINRDKLPHKSFYKKIEMQNPPSTDCSHIEGYNENKKLTLIQLLKLWKKFIKILLLKMN